MKANYRIVFHDGPEGSNSKSVDVYASSMKEAREKAYKMPEAKTRELYSEFYVQEIPREPSTIGIEFEYTSPYINGVCTGYLFIKANDEAQAVKYYNEHFKGKSFAGAHYGKNVEGEHTVRGRIRSTYFANGMKFHADATIEGKEASLNDEIVGLNIDEAARNLSRDFYILEDSSVNQNGGKYVFVKPPDRRIRVTTDKDNLVTSVKGGQLPSLDSVISNAGEKVRSSSKEQDRTDLSRLER